MYRLRIKRGAERDLRRLPRAVVERINKKILSLQHEPRPDGVRKLSGNLEGWRIRVGDYRIIYQIDDETKIVMIIRIRHRRDIYET